MFVSFHQFGVEKGRGDGKVDTAVSNSDQGLFQKDALNGHNEYRSQHGADPLTLSDDLCKSALDWAQHLAQNDLFEHSKRTDIGENVAMHYSSATTEYSGKSRPLLSSLNAISKSWTGKLNS